jgi:hypothetical protein
MKKTQMQGGYKSIVACNNKYVLHRYTCRTYKGIFVWKVGKSKKLKLCLRI